MQRLGMSKLDWLVVRDFSLIESATWWKDGPEIESGEMRTEEIATEVFFFPAAAHIEKDGTFTNTQRMVQWHHKAAGASRRAAERPLVHLPPRSHAPRTARGSTTTSTARARSDLGLPDRRRARRSERRRGPRGDQRVERRRRDALRLHRPESDGSTSCGCWIYCGSYADGVNQTARRTPAREQNWTGGGVGLGMAGEPADPL